MLGLKDRIYRTRPVEPHRRYRYKTVSNAEQGCRHLNLFVHAPVVCGFGSAYSSDIYHRPGGRIQSHYIAFVTLPFSTPFPKKLAVGSTGCIHE